MDKECTRSLTCKTHSLTLRRQVPGRSSTFDELLEEHRKLKEEALRLAGKEVKPTKKQLKQKEIEAKKFSSSNNNNNSASIQINNNSNSASAGVSATLTIKKQNSPIVPAVVNDLRPPTPAAVTPSIIEKKKAVNAPPILLKGSPNLITSNRILIKPKLENQPLNTFNNVTTINLRPLVTSGHVNNNNHFHIHESQFSLIQPLLPELATGPLIQRAVSASLPIGATTQINGVTYISQAPRPISKNVFNCRHLNLSPAGSVTNSTNSGHFMYISLAPNYNRRNDLIYSEDSKSNKRLKTTPATVKSNSNPASGDT